MSPETTEREPGRYNHPTERYLIREVKRQLGAICLKTTRERTDRETAFRQIQGCFNSDLPYEVATALTTQKFSQPYQAKTGEWPTLEKQLREVLVKNDQARWYQIPTRLSALKQSLRQHHVQGLWRGRGIDFGHILLKGLQKPQPQRLPICEIWVPSLFRPVVHLHGPHQTTPAIANNPSGWEKEPGLRSDIVSTWLRQLTPKNKKEIIAVLFPGISVTFNTRVTSVIGQAVDKVIKDRGIPGDNPDGPRGLESTTCIAAFLVLRTVPITIRKQSLPYKITALVGQHRRFSPEAEEIISDYQDRIAISRAMGRITTASAMANPFQGGLPGLGKRH